MFRSAKWITFSFVAATICASVAAKPTASQKPTITGPHLIKLVKPDCSKGHACHGKHGVVVITVDVLADGTVGDAEIKSGDEQLADDALKAAKQCRFTPGTFNGQPKSMNCDLEFKF